MSSSSRTLGVASRVVVSGSERCRGLLSGLLGQLSFSAGGDDDLWRPRRKKAMVQRRMRRRVEVPMAIPAMAPALKWWRVWMVGGRFASVTDTDDC